MPAAEVTEVGLRELTGLDTPAAGALEQSIFYVNQVMQFGKLLAIVQAHPTDSGRSVVSVFTALAIESNILSKQKQYGNVPVLRNMVPSQVLAGRSSFNSGKSLSAGLPVYAATRSGRSLRSWRLTALRPAEAERARSRDRSTRQSQACDTRNPSIFRPFLP